MKANTFSRLVEFSYLDDNEREALLDQSHPREISDYLQALNSLGKLDAPQPTSSKKWAGRIQLLEAVDASRSKAAPAVQILSWLRDLRIPAAGLAVGTLLFASAVIGSSVVGLSGSTGTFSEVLSALGLRSAPEISQPSVLPGSEPVIPQVDLGVPGDILNDESAPDFDVTAEPGLQALDVEQAGSPGGLPPQNPANPHGGENPGQGVEPPGLGGENPGQGVEPPGLGGENPGQGAEPPGLGGENPGQGAEPPGPGSNPPGQSSDGAGQGSGNPNLGQGQGGGVSQAADDQGNSNLGSKGNQP